MNPVDHPHGGGEGRAPIGRSGPMSLLGVSRLWEAKTRKPKKKQSTSLIVRRRRKSSKRGRGGRQVLVSGGLEGG